MTLDSRELPVRCPDPDCGVEVAASASRCPVCGCDLGELALREVIWRPPATRGMKIAAWIILATMFACLLIGLLAVALTA